jgi:hypothetical protein
MPVQGLRQAAIPVSMSTPHRYGVCGTSSMWSLKAHTGFEPLLCRCPPSVPVRALCVAQSRSMRFGGERCNVGAPLRPLNQPQSLCSCRFQWGAKRSS